jgi:antitoxin component YwqK of YwqJK toxin-antitoxin module
MVLTALVCDTKIAFSQSSEKTEINAARVTVSMNADGSRTVYQFDDAQHKAIATTTGQDGELRQTIRYELDDVGRFSGGRVFGPDGRLRFKSRYTYDSGGRLQEETQSAENDKVLHKIVYSYDQNGKQTGYSIFDASGKLLGRTSPLVSAPSPSPKSREKSSR